MGRLPVLSVGFAFVPLRCRLSSDPLSCRQGLFRVAPSASKLKKLKAALDCCVLDVQEYSADPHAIAGAPAAGGPGGRGRWRHGGRAATSRGDRVMGPRERPPPPPRARQRGGGGSAGRGVGEAPAILTHGLGSSHVAAGSGNRPRLWPPWVTLAGECPWHITVAHSTYVFHVQEL